MTKITSIYKAINKHKQSLIFYFFVILWITDKLWLPFVVCDTPLCQWNYSRAVIHYSLIVGTLVTALIISYRAVVAYRYHYVGRRYSIQGNYTAAIENYDKAIKLQPDDADYHRSRCIAFYETKNFKAALLDVNKVIELTPKDFRLYELRGFVNVSLENFPIALTDFEQAIKLGSIDPVIYANRGRMYEAIGDHHKALIDYNKAIELKPDYALAYLVLGDLYAEKLDCFDDAEETYRKGIDLNTKESRLYYQLGFLLLGHFHRYAEAEMMFLKSLELEPDDEMALYCLACIKSLSHDLEPAFDYLRSAIEKGFDRPWAWEDADLDGLKDDRRFTEIVGPRPLR